MNQRLEGTFLQATHTLWRCDQGANLADAANATPQLCHQSHTKRGMHQSWELNPKASVLQMPTPMIGFVLSGRQHGWLERALMPARPLQCNSQQDWRLTLEHVAEFRVTLWKLQAHSPGQQNLPRQNHQALASVGRRENLDRSLEAGVFLKSSRTLYLRCVYMVCVLRLVECIRRVPDCLALTWSNFDDDPLPLQTV